MTLSRTFLLLVLAAASASASPADAADRRVVVTNKTSYTIKAFQASNTGRNNWEENILGNNVLEPGQQVTINIDDGSGACHFDFLATFEDNDAAQKDNVDVCTVETFDFTE